jgi:hypothetical protein
MFKAALTFIRRQLELSTFSTDLDSNKAMEQVLVMWHVLIKQKSGDLVLYS